MDSDQYQQWQDNVNGQADVPMRQALQMNQNQLDSEMRLPSPVGQHDHYGRPISSGVGEILKEMIVHRTAEPVAANQYHYHAPDRIDSVPPFTQDRPISSNVGERLKDMIVKKAIEEVIPEQAGYYGNPHSGYSGAGNQYVNPNAGHQAPAHSGFIGKPVHNHSGASTQYVHPASGTFAGQHANANARYTNSAEHYVYNGAGFSSAGNQYAHSGVTHSDSGNQFVNSGPFADYAGVHTNSGNQYVQPGIGPASGAASEQSNHNSNQFVNSRPFADYSVHDHSGSRFAQPPNSGSNNHFVNSAPVPFTGYSDNSNAGNQFNQPEAQPMNTPPSTEAFTGFSANTSNQFIQPEGQSNEAFARYPNNVNMQFVEPDVQSMYAPAATLSFDEQAQPNVQSMSTPAAAGPFPDQSVQTMAIPPVEVVKPFPSVTAADQLVKPDPKSTNRLVNIFSGMKGKDAAYTNGLFEDFSETEELPAAEESASKRRKLDPDQMIIESIARTTAEPNYMGDPYEYNQSMNQYHQLGHTYYVPSGKRSVHFEVKCIVTTCDAKGHFGGDRLAIVGAHNHGGELDQEVICLTERSPPEQEIIVPSISLGNPYHVLPEKQHYYQYGYTYHRPRGSMHHDVECIVDTCGAQGLIGGDHLKVIKEHNHHPTLAPNV